jgi:hypothetical protein
VNISQHACFKTENLLIRNFFKLFESIEEKTIHNLILEIYWEEKVEKENPRHDKPFQCNYANDNKRITRRFQEIHPMYTIPQRVEL